ncbi:MAG: Glycosyl hydrolase [Bacteroidetes bacterium]|nr:MAG: Glycosyl hydrolase [Bacteroidota bacterium]
MRIPSFRLIAFLFSAAAVIMVAFSVKSPEKSRSISAARKKEHRESPTEALDALQFLSLSRSYPNVDIPPDAYGKAWEFYRQHFAPAPNRAAAIGNWTSIGPNNMGGRTLCVVLQPNDTGTVWLGSASGGLWKSTTGGIGQNAWTYVPIGYPVLGVSSIAFHPTNPNIMFIGTGETYNYGTSTNGLTDRTTRGTHGMGIFKSTDGGLTWTPSLNWMYQQNRGIWEIVFNPLNPNTLYAATTEGVYKSTDLGASWNSVLNAQMVTDLVIHKTDTAILMAGVGNMNSTGKGLYRTTNSGQNWSIVANGLPANTHDGRITISLWDDNNDVAIAQVANAFNTVGFYTTADKGLTWTPRSTQDVMSYQGWYSEGMVIKPGMSSSILAGGVELHESADGGNNFSTTAGFGEWLHSDIHDVILNPLNPDHVYIATDGGLYRSNDFGQTVYSCVDGYVTTQFYIGSVSATDPNIALGGLQDNFTNQYLGTNYWTLGVLGGDGCYNAIDPTNDYTQYAAYQNLNVFVSYDQGQSFWDQIINTPASAFGNNPAAFLAPYILAPSSPAVMYAGSEDLNKSIDGGMSWNPLGNTPFDPDGNDILSLAVSHTNPDTLYVATAPDLGPLKVYRTDNGGTSFTSITGSLPNRFPRRIAVNPQNSKEVYIVFSGFGTGHVFKSTNAGATWTDISTSLPDVPFHCLTVDPDYPNIIYAGSDFGIFASTDGGTTWTAHNTGFHDATMVFDLVISPSDRGLMAYTHGAGVYKRSLNDLVGIQPAGGSVFLFHVYPNPADEKITVGFEGRSGMLRLHDLHGKRVLEKNIVPGESVDISALPAGAYLLDLQVNGNRSVKKIMKR